MSINPILPQYLDRGLQLFPCERGGKRPLLPNGFHGASGDLDQIAEWADHWPGCNWAMPTAGWLVVDVDGADNPWPNDAERALELAGAPMARTPRGGRHYFFSDPSCRYRCATGKLGPNVDHRADGGYCLVHPSSTADGAYQWIESIVDTIPGTPPAWLVEALTAVSPGNLASFRVDAPHEQGSPILEGGRNDSLTRLAGKLRHVGCTFDQIVGALRNENRTNCRPPLADSEVETIARSVTRYEPDQIATIVAESAAEPPEIFTGPDDPGQLPESLWRVPGFINEVIDYNLATAFKPQPVLALAGALSLLATLTGRRVTDHVGTRTNLYCLGVAESGAGKDQARKVNKGILHDAGLDKHMGPEGLASSSGLVNAVERQPEILFQIDEIGRLLKTLGNAQQNPHLYNIVTVLMRLFTSSDSVYLMDAYADTERNKSITNPHACLYGTTVPKSLYEGLTADSLTDGFLSRMLIFEASDCPKKMPIVSPPPELILQTARSWADMKPPGNLSDKNPSPFPVPSTADANDAMKRLDALADVEHKRLGDPLGVIWTRATEKANKLALLRACSVAGPVRESLRIDASAAWWASSVVEHLTRRMIFLGHQWIVSTPYDAKLKRVFRIIDGGGPRGATLTTINNNTGLPARERAEILHDLIVRGMIFEPPTENLGRGKPTSRYVSTRFAGAVVANH